MLLRDINGDVYDGDVAFMETWLKESLPLILLQVNDSQLFMLTLFMPHFLWPVPWMPRDLSPLLLECTERLYYVAVQNLVYMCRNVNLTAFANVETSALYHF